MTNENTPVTQNEGKAKKSLIREIFDYAEIFVIAACAVLLMFNLSIRLCRVDGSSMSPTLSDSQLLISSDLFYTPHTGDIVIFHQDYNENASFNKPLVKRVIATGGQYYRIEYLSAEDVGGYSYVKMSVYVGDSADLNDGDLLEEDYIDYKVAYANKRLSPVPGTVLTGFVPEGQVFVMGDNRYNSNDSRFDVGLVDERCILGKAIFSLNPFGGVE